MGRENGISREAAALYVRGDKPLAVYQRQNRVKDAVAWASPGLIGGMLEVYNGDADAVIRILLKFAKTKPRWGRGRGDRGRGRGGRDGYQGEDQYQNQYQYRNPSPPAEG